MITVMVIKLIIEYRIEDYGNMKAIGIFDSEIRKSLILELLVYFLLSTPLGIFLGLILSNFVVDLYSSLSPGISFNIYPISYFYFSLHIITIIILVLLLQFRKLKKMNLAEITKLKTFG